MNGPVIFVRQVGPTCWRVCCLMPNGDLWQQKNICTEEADAEEQSRACVEQWRKKGEEVNFCRRDPRIA